MKQENVNKILSELVDNNGFVNVGKNEVDKLKENVDIVDAIKVNGKYEQIGDLLSKAISTLEDENRGRIVKKILFVIKIPVDSNYITENMSQIYNVLDTFGEDCECIWGISTNEKLQGEYIELIVAVGLK